MAFQGLKSIKFFEKAPSSTPTTLYYTREQPLVNLIDIQYCTSLVITKHLNAYKTSLFLR